MRYANEYGVCKLTELPGCSQIVVSNNAFIRPQHRGQGKGFANHLLRLERAEKLGYDVIMCTVVSTNVPEIRILEKAKWEKLFEFKSSKTENMVQLWIKRLSDEH